MPADLHDPDWLRTESETRSASSIARQLGISPDTVLRAMRLHHIPVRFATSKRQPVRPQRVDLSTAQGTWSPTNAGQLVAPP